MENLTGRIFYESNREQEDTAYLVGNDNQRLLIIIRGKGASDTANELLHIRKIEAGSVIELRECRLDNFEHGIPAAFCREIKETTE